jgi:galactokinase
VTDIADRPEVAPELRLVPHAFRETFGRPAQGVWYAPGVLTLLAGHPRSLSVCARWGAIVAGERRTDGVLELASINRPAERASLWATDPVPPWADPVAAVAERIGVGTGVTLLCSVDLPRGAGLSAATALACAAALAIRDMQRPDLSIEDLIGVVADSGVPELDATAAFLGRRGHALGRDRFARPFDLAGSGQRLLVVDTRIRRGPAGPPVRAQDVAGDLGQALTEYHRSQYRDAEQDVAVSAALAAGARGASAVADEPGRPVVVLADAAVVPRVRAAVTAACDRAPRYLTVQAARGAYRVS